MIRLLIASYYFPPAAGGGVQRVLAWSKYLSEFDVEVHVLTPDDPGWLQSDGGLTIPENVTVHRTKNWSPKSIRPSEVVGGKSGLGKAVTKAKLMPRRLLMPDIHVGWSLAARKTAAKIVRDHNIDVVLTTSPPRSTHFIGSYLAKRLGIPWIADYRDSWLDLPHTRLEVGSVRAKQKLQVKIATKTMERASLITTVSEPLAADLRTRHPHAPVKVITNGVDFEDLEELPEAPPLEGNRKRDKVFTLTYTGNFFGRQTPKHLLDAVERFIDEDWSRAETLVIRFVGSMQPEQAARLTSSTALKMVCQHIPFQPYATVLAEQKAADALLLYVAPGRGSQGVYTGKVFEYVASRRPVLAMVPNDNVAGQLVRDAGSGSIVDPDNVDAIVEQIRSMHDMWKANGRRDDCAIPQNVIDSISRREQTGELASRIAHLAPVRSAASS